MAEFKDREHFIAVRKADLIDLLCGTAELPADERDVFRQFCRLIEATFHHEYHQRLEAMKNAYAFFDPDAETQEMKQLPAEEKEKRIAELFAEFMWLLEKANFKRLSRAEIIKAVKDPSDWGLDLDVDFNIFDRLEIYARGDAVQRRVRRRWRRMLRQEEVDVAIYERLAIILRLRPSKRLGRFVDTQSIYLKLFKEMPKVDLEMLLPGSRARMSILDRCKLTVPPVGGVGYTLWGIGLANLSAVLTATVWVAILGYGVRSLFGYMNTKKKYQLTLMESLYFQNLDNNSGVLFRLLDEAEEQECREAMLAYFFLWRYAGVNGWTSGELDERVEQYLEKTLQMKVDFEIGDALDKLRRLKIIEDQLDGRMTVVPIATALEIMDHRWDDYFQYNRGENVASRSA